MILTAECPYCYAEVTIQDGTAKYELVWCWNCDGESEYDGHVGLISTKED